ncbi:DUF5050 domain-containing protein [Youngiibacter multivorans]|uniref:Prolow-density lipoprotein receptor-related protein 1-like beta-propeller domain-containing protein n=1 Tax=Youngiibacter multivorans TaxID=937251 RepID=A0ABS4G2H2_9CLOT|nr:DUF5050 domain-containing protein [Youngiibacter multivorans]MBP1918745.1 hypothetical protein [Youngiibacter multivorans]
MTKRIISGLLLLGLFLSTACSDNAGNQTAPTTGNTPTGSVKPTEISSSKNELKLGGLGTNTANSAAYGMAVELDGDVYHLDRIMEGNILKSVTSGSTELLLKGTYSGLNAKSEHLFFFNYDSSAIMSLDLKSMEQKEIRRGSATQLLLNDEYLYFTDYDGILSRIKYDGTGEAKLAEDIWEGFQIYDNYIYFDSSDLNKDSSDYSRYVYRLPLNGGTPEKVVDEALFKTFAVGEGYIFYETVIDGSSTIRRTDSAGNNTVTLFNKSLEDILIVSGKLYYFTNGRTKDKSDQGLYLADLDGKNDTMIIKLAGASFNIAGSSAYFLTSEDDRALNAVNLDGTNLRKIAKSE